MKSETTPRNEVTIEMPLSYHILKAIAYGCAIMAVGVPCLPVFTTRVQITEDLCRVICLTGVCGLILFALAGIWKAVELSAAYLRKIVEKE